MGVGNAAVKRLAFPDLTTMVLAMILTGLGMESGRQGQRGDEGVGEGVAWTDGRRGSHHAATAISDTSTPSARGTSAG